MTSQCLQARVASQRISSRIFWVSASEHLVKIGAVPNLQKDKCLKSQWKVVGRESNEGKTEKLGDELKPKDATTVWNSHWCGANACDLSTNSTCGSNWLEELQCVCLSPLAVQNILQPVQQAQTGR